MTQNEIPSSAGHSFSRVIPQFDSLPCSYNEHSFTDRLNNLSQTRIRAPHSLQHLAFLNHFDRDPCRELRQAQNNDQFQKGAIRRVSNLGELTLCFLLA